MILALGFTVQDANAQGQVIGIVIDADGDPVAGAQVMLTQMVRGRGERPFRAETQTDRRGLFEFNRVPAGNYMIAAGAEDLGRARVQIEVADREVTHVRLELQGRNDDERGVGAVVGFVQTPDGEGVAGVRIILTPMRRGRVRPMTTVSDRRGNFAFVEVPEGMYMVQAIVRGGYASARLEVVADQRNRVRLVLHRRGGRGGGGERGDWGDRNRWRHE